VSVTTIEVAPDKFPAGSTVFHAEPSEGRSRFEVGLALWLDLAATRFLDKFPAGSTDFHAELWHGRRQSEESLARWMRVALPATGFTTQVMLAFGLDYTAKARQRIAELRIAPSPWDNEPWDMGDGTAAIPTAVVSSDAEAAAIAVFSRFTAQPPPSAVAIFPREDGGLRLQTVGQERAVVVDISAAGNEFACEYAGDDVFHTETIRNPDDAARFITDSTR
jgi:hypothetical protein